MKLKIYYSGEENLGRPECVLSDKCNLMLTFDKYKATGRPDKRFKLVLKSRKKKQKAEERIHGRVRNDQ